MQNKLQELTDRIYQEGVARGKKEAEIIIAEAKTESEKIIEEARRKAEAIISKAEQEAQELKKKTLSELRISFRNAMSALKQDVERLIALKVIGEPVSEAFSDKDFLARMIEITTAKLSAGTDNAEMDIFVPEKMSKEIEKYLKAKMSKVMLPGLVLHPSGSMEKGFEIKPGGKEYKISVTDTDFAGYLKEFLRPKLLELLFEK